MIRSKFNTALIELKTLKIIIIFSFLNLITLFPFLLLLGKPLMTPSIDYYILHSFSTFLNPFPIFLIHISNSIMFSLINSFINHLLFNFLYARYQPVFVNIYLPNLPFIFSYFIFVNLNLFVIFILINYYLLFVLVHFINYHLFSIILLLHLNFFK